MEKDNQEQQNTEEIDKMSEFVTPDLAAGFRDYLPEDMIPRQGMFDTIRGVFERFGFVPLDTPGMEGEEVLTGGDENFSMQIFRARLRKKGSGEEEASGKFAMRFDLTVPLARVVAKYPNEIDKPFKRYQAGNVWRGEKPQAGRFREFAQFDADIVGTSRMSADAEIIALIYETMTALGVPNFLVRVNNRKVLNGLPAYIGFSSEKIGEVLRLVDKLGKFGWDNVSGELKDKLGFSDEQLEALKRFLDLHADDNRSTAEAVKALMANSEIGLEGANELSEIVDHVAALGVPDSAWTIDLSIARGLEYYTGPVFETVLADLPSIGSVFSGGRYDNLVERFGPVSVPATGASIGVDRLFTALEKLKLVEHKRTVARVLVLNFNKDCETTCEVTATRFRRAGIATEIYFGKEVTLKGQLAYAVRKEFPIVIIIGPDEKERGVLKMKNMAARRQIEMSQGDVDGILAAAKKILDS